MPFCLGLPPLPSFLWVWERQIQRMGTGEQADEREQSGGSPCTNAPGVITDWAKVTILLGGLSGNIWLDISQPGNYPFPPLGVLGYTGMLGLH